VWLAFSIHIRRHTSQLWNEQTVGYAPPWAHYSKCKMWLFNMMLTLEQGILFMLLFLWVVCLMDLYQWESLLFVCFHVFCHTSIIICVMWTHLDFFSKSGYHGTTRYFFFFLCKKKEICFLFRLTRAFPKIMSNLFTDRLTGTLHVNLFISLI
jgi:hypothetical protein